jgi:hypothetical protein
MKSRSLPKPVARQASAQEDLSARSPSPRPLSPLTRAKLFVGQSGTSAVIILSTIPTMDSDAATTNPPHHEDKHDKTGDESRHHPQQKPLIRFHLSFSAEARARRSLALDGLVTATVRSYLAKMRQLSALRRQHSCRLRAGMQIHSGTIPHSFSQNTFPQIN